MTKRRINLGTFEWKSGSINDNIIRLARAAGYEYQYNLSTLQIGFDPIWYNAGHTHIKDNIVEAYIEA